MTISTETHEAHEALEALERLELAAYKRGLADGLARYAWWDNGVQYVGTCGQTLEAALAWVDTITEQK